MNQKAQNSDPFDDGVSLWELVVQIKDGWRWWVSCGVIGLVIAFGFILLVPKQYQASVVIQPGTIGPTAVTAEMTIEPATHTLERLKLPAFYSEDTIKSCGLDSAHVLADRVQAKLINDGGDLLALSYRAKSAVLAGTCVNKIVEQLKQVEDGIVAPLLTEMREQQDFTQKQIDEAGRIFASQQNKVDARIDPRVIAALQQLRRGDIEKLQAQRLQLLKPLTQPLAPLEPIFTSEKPIAPNKLLVVFAGLFIGLFIGVVLLLVNRSWRATQEKQIKIAAHPSSND